MTIKYINIHQLPKDVKAILPDEAQEIFLEYYNIACDQGLPKGGCFRYAFQMVRNHGYRKDRTGMWRLVQYESV